MYIKVHICVDLRLIFYSEIISIDDEDVAQNCENHLRI